MSDSDPKDPKPLQESTISEKNKEEAKGDDEELDALLDGTQLKI